MISYPVKGLHAARRVFAAKLAVYRAALAAESDDTITDLLPEERALRLESRLAFAYVGPTGEEQRSEWKDLGQEAIDCDPLPERSGYYAVVDGEYQTGSVCFLIHYQDYRDREPTRSGSPAIAEERLRAQTFELSGIALAREARGREEAEARLAAAREEVLKEKREVALLKERIAELERERAEGGKGAMIFERIAPHLNEALEMVQRWDEREEARSRGEVGNAKETAKLRRQAEMTLRLISEIGAALAELPAAARDPRLRRLARRTQEELTDLLELPEETEEEAQPGDPAEPPAAERPTQPAPPDDEPEPIDEEPPALPPARTVHLDTPEARAAYSERAAERAEQLQDARAAARTAAREMEARRAAAEKKEPT